VGVEAGDADGGLRDAEALAGGVGEADGLADA